MGRFFSGGRLFAFLAGIILLVVLAGVSLRSRNAGLTWVEKFVLDGTSAVSHVLYEPAFQVETFFRRLHDLQTMYQENAALQLLANEDSTLRIQLQVVRQQNSDLKNMLHYKSSHPAFQLLTAEVTGRSPLSWNAIVTISVGSTDGVKRNMPVLSQEGALVGRVVSVAEYSSTVSLLSSTETANGVSATIVAPKQQPFGIVTGSATTSGMLNMQFISQLSGARAGDQVVTSGLSDMYPRGILIGRIKAFIADGSGITRSAIVTPAANFNYLDYVFVLVPQPGQVLP